MLKYSFIYNFFAIQTGFVETLKPQFVPGQVMAGSAAAANVVEEKLSHLQLQQENENLKSQVNNINKIGFIFSNYIYFLKTLQLF